MPVAKVKKRRNKNENNKKIIIIIRCHLQNDNVMLGASSSDWRNCVAQDAAAVFVRVCMCVEHAITAANHLNGHATSRFIGKWTKQCRKCQKGSLSVNHGQSTWMAATEDTWKHLLVDFVVAIAGRYCVLFCSLCTETNRKGANRVNAHITTYTHTEHGRYNKHTTCVLRMDIWLHHSTKLFVHLFRHIDPINYRFIFVRWQ